MREEMEDERIPDIERAIMEAAEKHFGPALEHARNISPWGHDRPIATEAIRHNKESKSIVVSLGHLAEIEDIDDIGCAQADAGVLWREKILITMTPWSTNPPVQIEQTVDPIQAMEKEKAAAKEADASAKKLAEVFAGILRGTLMQMGIRDARKRYHEIVLEELKTFNPEGPAEKLERAIERARRRITEEYRQ
jgi:hypothetical protein